MSRILTYRLMLMLTLLAGLFLMSSCQEEDSLYDTTEVMMTFTTRALVNAQQGDTLSTAIDQEKMKDLRVIMVRENGEIVGNHQVKNITQTSVTFKFRTPVNNGGEDFTFFAIANEGSITPANQDDLSWLTRAEGDKYTSEELNTFKNMQIGNGAFALSEGQSIPQTKQWTVEVPQKDTRIENQQLDYVASKVSVLFKNETEKNQSLSSINITGIPQSTAGYLFKQNANDYVGTQHDASDISFNNVENIAVGDSSAIQHYYTYPVDGIENAALHATWNEKPYELPLEGITELKRNDHLKIIVTLTPAQDITVNYEIAEWKEDSTNIGESAPNPGSSYDVKDWGNPNEIVVGGGGNDDPWANLGGSIIAGGDAFSNWAKVENQETNYVDLVIKGKYLKVGYGIAIEFTSLHPENECSLRFCTPWTHYFSDKFYFSGEGKKVITYIFDEETIKLIAKHNNEDQSTSIIVTDDYKIFVDTDLEVVNGQSNSNIVIHRMAIIDTN